MRYHLLPLPYAYDALEPVISKEIMELHHDKHHAAYVAGANTAFEKLEQYRAGQLPTLDVKATLRDLSFHANGHLLHQIFWQIMNPPANDTNVPNGKIGTLITASFGSFNAFKLQFSAAAKTVEGSGWAVVAITPQQDLLVLALEKHNVNLMVDARIVLCLDVWEHAYYLQYKNDRATYVDQWWKVVNWEKVEKLATPSG